MRDNVSIVFASIIAVFLLIVMPLFSIMSRQDSIAYNKVLTLTTEFVDSARTKGYVTSKEYSKYITELAMTNNTYKVNLEYHQNILIKDIEDNGAFVEDTLVYYNSDIIKALTVGENMDPEEVKLQFNVNDEFYVKLYNTNVTTASLLYNYFSGVKVAPKVINIAYGGKVSDVVKGEYIKTNFDTSYNPIIKFTTDVVNLNNESLKKSYEERVGDKVMVRYYSTFDLSRAENRTLSVNFEMRNFSKIGDIALKDFDERQEEIIQKIEDNIKLSGKVENYNATIIDYNYENGKLTGTISVSGIALENTLERTLSSVMISQGLGEGSTGIKSIEARTYDFILVNKVLDPRINITLQSESELTKQYGKQNSPTFQIELNDVVEGITKNDIEILYANTGEKINEDQYDLSITEIIHAKKYSVSVILHQDIYDQAIFDKWSDMLKIRVTARVRDVAAMNDEEQTRDISGEFVHLFYGSTKYQMSMARMNGYNSERDEYGFVTYKYSNISSNDSSIPFLWKGKTIRCKLVINKAEDFFDVDETRQKELASIYFNAIQMQMQIKRNSANIYNVNIGTSYNKDNIECIDGNMNLYIDIKIDSLPNTSFTSSNNWNVILLFNYGDKEVEVVLFNGTTYNKIMYNSEVPVPSGFTREEKDNNIYVTDTNGRKYKWLWYKYSGSWSSDIVQSIQNYGGFYVSVNYSNNTISEAEKNIYEERNDIFTSLSFKPSDFKVTLDTPYYYLDGKTIKDSNGREKSNSRFVSVANYYTALFIK